MTEDTGSPPRWQQAQTGPGRIVLTGQWTLAHALAISDQLRAIPDDITSVDASKIGRLDSAGVMQLMRFAQRRGLDGEHLQFSAEHAALVQAIEDVSDDRPPRRRDYGFAAALERLGRATESVIRSVVGLVGFTGENLSKILRMAREPRRYLTLPVCAFGMAAVILIVNAYFSASVLRRPNASFYLSAALAALYCLTAHDGADPSENEVSAS